MLDKLLGFVESANFKNAVRQRRLACPDCGTAPGTKPSAPDDVIKCAKCGTAASALECAQPISAQRLVRSADERPAATRITREKDQSGAITWDIPASGKSGGLMFFALFWCGLTAILTAAAVFGVIERRGNLASIWWLVAFFGIFWAIGISFIYAACRSKYARHRLTVDPGTITLQRELFGHRKERRLPSAAVQTIAAVEFYQRNYQPVHGIEIRAPQGKLRFGSMLTEEEKAWLVADLNRAVFGSEPAIEASLPSASAKAAGRNEFFSVPLPLAPGRWLAPGIILVAISIVFILAGAFLMDGSFGPRPGERGKPGESPMDFFLGSFRVLWIGSSCVFGMIGIGLITRHVKTRHHQTHLEGTRDNLVLRTTKHGRIVHQQDFPKEEFLDIRSSRAGSANGKSMKRIELLIGAKAHTLARWVDGEMADAFVSEVRRACFAP